MSGCQGGASMFDVFMGFIVWLSILFLVWTCKHYNINNSQMLRIFPSQNKEKKKSIVISDLHVLSNIKKRLLENI